MGQVAPSFALWSSRPLSCNLPDKFGVIRILANHLYKLPVDHPHSPRHSAIWGIICKPTYLFMEICNSWPWTLIKYVTDLCRAPLSNLETMSTCRAEATAVTLAAQGQEVLKLTTGMPYLLTGMDSDGHRLVEPVEFVEAVQGVTSMGWCSLTHGFQNEAKNIPNRQLCAIYEQFTWIPHNLSITVLIWVFLSLFEAQTHRFTGRGQYTLVFLIVKP